MSPNGNGGLSDLKLRGGCSNEMAEDGGSAIWMRSCLDMLGIRFVVRLASTTKFRQHGLEGDDY
jgi:hypothetical protein